jgi:hypothetical protein
VVGTYSGSVIDHIIDLCGFPSDSIMVKCIKEEGLTRLEDVVTLSLHDVNDFQIANDAGYKVKPLAHHNRKLRGFLLYYSKKCRELSFILDTNDVMMISKKEFNGYLGSPAYHTELQMHLQSEALITKQVEVMNEILLYDQIIAFIAQDNFDMVDDIEQVDFIEEGSLFKVLVELEPGETLHESLDWIVEDNPDTCDPYIWTHFNALGKSNKMIPRMVNQPKTASAPVWGADIGKHRGIMTDTASVDWGAHVVTDLAGHCTLKHLCIVKYVIKTLEIDWGPSFYGSKADEFSKFSGNQGFLYDPDYGEKQPDLMGYSLAGYSAAALQGKGE